MVKYEVSAVEVITYKANIEAESKKHAEELAFQDGYLWNHGKVMFNEIEPESICIDEA